MAQVAINSSAQIAYLQQIDKNFFISFFKSRFCELC